MILVTRPPVSVNSVVAVVPEVDKGIDETEKVPTPSCPANNATVAGPGSGIDTLRFGFVVSDDSVPPPHALTMRAAITNVLAIFNFFMSLTLSIWSLC